VDVLQLETDGAAAKARFSQAPGHVFGHLEANAVIVGCGLENQQTRGAVGTARKRGDLTRGALDGAVEGLNVGEWLDRGDGRDVVATSEVHHARETTA
jgi:hypothetical protein